jgi:uridylate kinase
MKKVIVISLGGSLIVQDKVNFDFLKEFKKVLLKHSRKYKFVVVCGGGKPARTYINGLEDVDIQNKLYYQSFLGISITRTNARFMTYFFGNDANEGIPHDMKRVKNLLKYNRVVFCGALRYSPEQTSDTTSAKLAHYFKCDFINMTNVKGLYDKNPKKFRSAKFISDIGYNDFLNMARQIEYKPGQHFVLDQKAAKIIKDYKIQTFILGSNEALDNLLNEKHFMGSVIGG